MVKDIFASTEALAFLTEGGVVTWSVYEEEMVAHLHLGAVKDCVGSFFSFAFLFRDGSVKSWGSKAYGGDSSEVSEELSRDVLAIEHRGIFERGFVAWKANSTAIIWGHYKKGIPLLSQVLHNVRHIELTLGHVLKRI